VGNFDTFKNHVKDQFSDVPNWRSYYTIVCEFIDELYEAGVYYAVHRWLETAYGFLLDVCGAIIGLPRPYAWVTDGIFTWDTVEPDEMWDVGLWSSYRGIRTTTLVDDDIYRPLLRAKAYANGANSSLYAIAKTIKLGFDIDCTVTTPSARVVSITFNEPVSQWARYYIRELVPVQGDTDLVLLN
jgi:hypothetical protein